MMRSNSPLIGIALTAIVLAGCGSDQEAAAPVQQERLGTPVAVNDTMVSDLFNATGVAEPVQSATLSTKLMARVTEVLVHAGDKVKSGQLLVRLDSRDLAARQRQVEANLAQANAVRTEAAAQAQRIRGLYADSAATRSQLDNVNAALARAQAGVRMAEAGADELKATTSYAKIHAPFGGMITERSVDPGALAAPGSPLVRVEDTGTLRITVDATPEAVSGLQRGTTVTAMVGDSAVTARVEGVVPSGTNRYVVNALVDNRAGRLMSGSSASIAIERGVHRALLVPVAAIVRRDDLTGVRLLVAGRVELRWVRAGRNLGDAIEILAGVAPGDSVMVRDGSN